VRILVALDFSECSGLAVRWALERVRGLSVDEIVFHHVIDPDEAPPEQLGALEKAVAEVRTFVEVLLEPQMVPEDVELRYAISRGKPADEILEAAHTHRAHTIVMGTQGRRGLDRLLLGSVAEAVVRRAPCTVVVVKPEPTS